MSGMVGIALARDQSKGWGADRPTCRSRTLDISTVNVGVPVE